MSDLHRPGRGVTDSEDLVARQAAVAPVHRVAGDWRGVRLASWPFRLGWRDDQPGGSS